MDEVFGMYAMSDSDPFGEPGNMDPVEVEAFADEEDDLETAGILTSSDDDDELIAEETVIVVEEVPAPAPAAKAPAKKKVAKKAAVKKVPARSTFPRRRSSPSCASGKSSRNSPVLSCATLQGLRGSRQ